MTAMVGADVEALRALADLAADRARVLRQAAGTVSGAMDAMEWAGLDAVGFAARWELIDRPAMMACVDALEDSVGRILAHADAQERASSEGFGPPVAFAPAVGSPIDTAVMPEAARAFRDAAGAMTAAQVCQAWGGLDQGTRDWLLRHRPYLIGNLDGIPFETRTIANESEVVRWWNSFDRARRAVQAENPQWSAEDVDAMAGTRVGLSAEQLAALKHTHCEFPGPGSARAERFQREPVPHLVAFDLTGGDLPRAAVAIGNLDTATYIGTYIPGMGSKVGKGIFHTHLDSAQGLYSAVSEILAETGSSRNDSEGAVVYWLGYDAPQGASAVVNASANEGMDLLTSFANGMEAVNPQAYKTAAGHSYGSIVAAGAAENTDAFDAMVVFGSPGISPFDVWGSQVPRAARYYGAAEGDWIAGLTPSGDSPTTHGFHRLPTWAVDGYQESTGHSQYLWQDTSFQRSLAAIIAHHEEKIPGR